MRAATRFGTYKIIEITTADGTLLRVACKPEEVESIKATFAENILNISPVQTCKMMSHGGYGAYTRYEIIQHKYAGGSSNFIEVLEITNPPEDRSRYVVYLYCTYEPSKFFEFSSLKSAVLAFDAMFSGHNHDRISGIKGFVREVVCGPLTPWFYAVGNQQLLGDYAAPVGIEDDSVFRLGARFVVYSQTGTPSVKTCMGTRFVKKDPADGRQYARTEKIEAYRIVFWSDGTTWSDRYKNGYPDPRPLREDEEWIAEATYEFNRLLAGESTEFSIEFQNGGVFTAKLKPKKGEGPWLPGTYRVLIKARVSLTKEEREERMSSNETEVVEQDTEFLFVPTPEMLDLVEAVRARLKMNPRVMEVLSIKVLTRKKGEKKWVGVFPNPKA